MARSPRKKNNSAEPTDDQEYFLHPETRKGVLAIILFTLSLILSLSAFNQAGPAGQLIWSTLSGLFGIGYYLLPPITLIMAAALFVSGRRRPLSRTLIGGFLFVLAGLGFIDLVWPAHGGVLGSLAGLIEVPFGYLASLIIVTALIAVSLLITLNLPLRLPFFYRPHPTADHLTKSELEKIGDAADAEEAETKPDSNEEKDASQPDLEIKESGLLGLLKRPKSKKINFENYVPPPLDLLKVSSEKATAGDLRLGANTIKRTFESFNIPVEMGEINIGPKVTRYTLKPAEGVKLSKIVALNQDLALALAAHPIRIEAPIPGRSLVGIEVPNKTAAIVRLGNLIGLPDFNEAGPLGVILGRDVTGEPIIEDIDKMPHLLIAGATGSGKSVAIHTILISLLYKNSPETMRLILVDPKRVELSVYQNLPHLVAPVVTQNKKAIGVFRWAINEMEKRYEQLEDVGARDIRSYNDKMAKSKHGAKMPYILIVVDELADLMSSYGKEVEGYIVRISQMARAVGLHLLLATQRPSVEVITGLIKANITTRLALKVASQIDSRTILDTAGAEKLLGGGDTLVLSARHSKPKRIQGALVTEEEINAVTDFIRDHNRDLTAELSESEAPPEFENGQTAPGPKTAPNVFDEFDGTDGADDDLLEDAVDLVRQSGKASASLLQRRLKVGYARAARLLDIMEEKGIIGPGEGAKPREVFLDNGGSDRFNDRPEEV